MRSVPPVCTLCSAFVITFHRYDYVSLCQEPPEQCTSDVQPVCTNMRGALAAERKLRQSGSVSLACGSWRSPPFWTGVVRLAVLRYTDATMLGDRAPVRTDLSTSS